MRKNLAALAAITAALGVSAPASAATPPPGAIKNMKFITNLPEGRQATAINFLTYGHGRKARDVMLITGRFGLKTYDMKNPEKPKLLDELGNDELVLRYDIELGRTPSETRTFWQNEDMDVDQKRKLAFLSRDPRAYGGSTNSDTDVAGVYIIDAKNPSDLKLITFQQLPAGHTTSCINDCKWLWTGGPASSPSQRTDLGWAGGRPIIVTDLRNPRMPVSYPARPVDLFRQDGVTAYSHDVDVDSEGIAWVSGLGGVRGYWTEGRHRDPRTGQMRQATPLDPIPYAGGGFPDDAVDEVNNPGGWMHNSARPTARDVAGWGPLWNGGKGKGKKDDKGKGKDKGKKKGKDKGNGPDAAAGFKPGSLVMGTEEDFNATTCDGEGQFTIASLEGSYNGEGWRSTPEKPFRLKTVGTWSPKDKEATVPLPSCSAHYFDVRSDGLIAYAWYGQGTRILNIEDPRNPTQVAYFRPDGGNVWASYWYGKDYVIVADNARGIDILKIDRHVSKKTKKGKREVVAPPMSKKQRKFLAQVSFAPDPVLGWACPLPQD
jgi:hypothetical protein